MHKRWIHSAKTLTLAAVVGAIAAAAPQATEAAYEDGKVRFGVPSWPGVTVKTEVASRILQSMGWETQQKQLSYPIIIDSITKKRLDVYLAGWYPQERELIEPLHEKGELQKLVANLPEVITGLAVPTYVAEKGIKSVADLTEHGGMFDRTIYGIEPGTGSNEGIKEAIKKDWKGLGDWDLIESGTSSMLAQVASSYDQEKPVVWIGWEPHWMNTVHDMHYLEDDEGSTVAQMTGQVFTVTPPDIADHDENVARFLKQFVLTPAIQSKWILEHSKKDRPKEAVAKEWLANNLDMVAKWLDGVKTRDGKPAIAAVRDDYGA